MPSVAELELLVQLKDQASSGLSSLGGALSSLGGIAAGVAVAGFAALSAAVVSGIGDAREAAQLNAQTGAVLKSTGNAAGVSAQHITDYATALSAASGKSLFGDSQIQESENLLLTFTNIKGATLDAATAMSVDLAQAMGGAPKDSAIQLGKALNDPVKGITALTRVGVTFTDEQKKQIKTMQEAGDVAGAQGIILAELNKEFGGSAAAAAAADGGWAQFNDRIGEAKESIGAALLPLLGTLAGFLNDTIAPAIEQGAVIFGDLVSAFTEAGDPILGIGAAINTLLNEVFGLNTSVGFLVTDGLDALGTAFQFVSDNAAPIAAGLGAIGVGILVSLVPAFIAWAGAATTAAAATIAAMAPVAIPIIAIGAAVALLVAAWQNDWGGIQEKTAAVWAFLQPTFQAVEDWLKVVIPAAVQVTVDFWRNTLQPALQAVWAFIQDKVIPIFNTVVGWLTTNIPAATKDTSDLWTNTLKPALDAVWGFISTKIIPIFTTLANITIGLVKLEVKALAALWSDVLKPALDAVWGFISANILPILASVASTLSTTLGPALTTVAGIISGAFQGAWSGVTGVISAVAGAIGSVIDAIGRALTWIQNLIDKLNSIPVPDILKQHSPSPLEQAILDVGSAFAMATGAGGLFQQQLNGIRAPSLAMAGAGVSAGGAVGVGHVITVNISGGTAREKSDAKKGVQAALEDIGSRLDARARSGG